MLHKITLKDLSHLSGFSVSTVSKALGNSAEISEETKIKIRKLSKEYRYIPNASARNLKTKATKTIGVILPNILSSFFSKVLSGLEHEVARRGYILNVCISNESIIKERQSIGFLRAGDVDGLIISLSKETQLTGNIEHLKSIIDDGLPVVMFDRISTEILCDKVVINDSEASYECTEFLLHRGCRNFVFVSPICKTNVGLARAKGYRDAILNFKDHKVTSTFFDFDNYGVFKARFNEFLSKNKIDAVVAADELSAVTAQNMILNKGFKIPQDISVIGFTNGILSENSNPPLTSVNQNESKIGKTAASILINRLEKKDGPFKTRIIKSNIIHRGSTSML